MQFYQCRKKKPDGEPETEPEGRNDKEKEKKPRNKVHMLVECQDGTFRKSKLKDCSTDKLTAMKKKCKGKDKKKKEKEDGKEKKKRDCDALATPAKVANCKEKQGISEPTTNAPETTSYG